MLTLAEAYDAACDDDLLICGEFRIAERKDNIKHHNIPFKAVYTRKWSVGEAEPKVLTTTEYLGKIGAEPDFSDTGYHFDQGDKNGQLKQWLNHKELRELCEDLFNQLSNEEVTLVSWISRYKRIIKKIVPLIMGKNDL